MPSGDACLMDDAGGVRTYLCASDALEQRWTLAEDGRSRPPAASASRRSGAAASASRPAGAWCATTHRRARSRRAGPTARTRARAPSCPRRPGSSCRARPCTNPRHDHGRSAVGRARGPCVLLRRAAAVGLRAAPPGRAGRAGRAGPDPSPIVRNAAWEAPLGRPLPRGQGFLLARSSGRGRRPAARAPSRCPWSSPDGPHSFEVYGDEVYAAQVPEEYVHWARSADGMKEEAGGYEVWIEFPHPRLSAKEVDRSEIAAGCNPHNRWRCYTDAYVRVELDKKSPSSQEVQEDPFYEGCVHGLGIRACVALDPSWYGRRAPERGEEDVLEKLDKFCRSAPRKAPCPGVRSVARLRAPAAARPTGRRVPLPRRHPPMRLPSIARSRGLRPEPGPGCRPPSPRARAPSAR